MISFYNMLLAYAFAVLPEPVSAERIVAVKEAVRGMALLLAIFVGTWHLLSPPSWTIKAFYERLFKNRIDWPAWAWWLVDAVVHFLPVFAVGLPCEPWSVPVAFAVFLVWYVAVRARFEAIYGLPSSFVDAVVLPIGALVAIMAYAGLFGQKK